MLLLCSQKLHTAILSSLMNFKHIPKLAQSHPSLLSPLSLSQHSPLQAACMYMYAYLPPVRLHPSHNSEDPSTLCAAP